MKLIESKAELVLQQEGLEGVYKQIELAGRTAYHSLDKITPDSAKDFVDRMIKSKHGAALEHGTVYLYYKENCYSNKDIEFTNKYENNKYSKVIRIGCDDNPWPDGSYHDIIGGPATGDSEYVITTNLRVLVENNWLDDLQYLCFPTEFHEKRYTMRFTCSRAIAQELTRHRAFSFLMESQRYINYSKERHGGEITFIKPSWGNDIEVGDYFIKHNYKEGTYSTNFGYVGYPQDYLTSLCEAENAYFEMLNKGCTPQQARDVLPNATKTELIMTGFASDWRFFFDLRYYGETGKPHPDMELLASKARSEFMRASLWDNIMAYPTKFYKDDTEGKDLDRYGS